MSNLIEIKKRIESITSTIKVTKVMQMIATAKVAKVKQIIISSDKYDKIANSILSEYMQNTKNAYLIDKFVKNNNKLRYKNMLLICMSADKGTCGGINTNIIKELNLLTQKNKQDNCNITICPIGKKISKYLELHSNDFKIANFTEEPICAENYVSADINKLVSKIINAYMNNEFDAICFMYHKFKNIITCNIVNEQILPIDRVLSEEKNNFINIYDSKNTLSSILEYFVRTKFYNSYISNLASVVSSRMSAMDNATKNGQEIINELRIKYNKTRQAGITSELSDIISGSEAIS